jgi:hypothetical protein
VLYRGWPELLQLFGFDDDALVGGVFVAPDQGIALHRAVYRTVLGVADALAAVGMEQMEGRRRAGLDGGIGLDRDTDQAEAEQAGPTGPATRRRSRHRHWGCARRLLRHWRERRESVVGKRRHGGFSFRESNVGLEPRSVSYLVPAPKSRPG